MRRNAIVRIVLFSILALSLVGVLIGGIAFKRYTSPGIILRYTTEAPVVSQNHFNAEEIDRLNIDWAAGEIVILPVEGSEIAVTEELLEEEDEMVLKLDGSTLYVEYCEGAVSLNFGSAPKKNLYITVPQDWVCKELEIDAASATVQAERLTIQKAASSTASGSHTFRDCKVEQLTLETVSGDLDYSGTLDKLDFGGVSAQADVVVTNFPKSIDVETVSGDVNLTLPKECGFTLEKDTVSGHFSSELETRKENGKYVYGDGQCKIDVEGVSASITIRKG